MLFLSMGMLVCEHGDVFLSMVNANTLIHLFYLTNVSMFFLTYFLGDALG